MESQVVCEEEELNISSVKIVNELEGKYTRYQNIRLHFRQGNQIMPSIVFVHVSVSWRAG